MRARKKEAFTQTNIRVLLVGWLIFLLSGCTSTFISYPLLDSTRIQKYECGTIPKLGNFFDYAVGSQNNFLLYSYDVDNQNYLVNPTYEVFDIDIKTKESKSIIELPAKGKKLNQLYYENLWMYEDPKNQEFTLIQNLIEGGNSNIYKVSKEKKFLLFSYPKPIYWSKFGLVESKDHKELDKLFLFYKQADYYEVFLISTTTRFVFKSLKLPLTLKSIKVTKDFLFAIQEELTEKKVLVLEKSTLSYQYLSYYPQVKFVGAIYQDNMVLMCDPRNNLIEILSSNGVVGTFASPIYPENLEVILAKKYPGYFGMFAIPKSTSYGMDNKCIWLKYFPASKQMFKNSFTLPKQLDYYFADSYESFSHEFVGLCLNHSSRESYLAFFYFNNGKVHFERIQHQNVGYKCEKDVLRFWPKERVFTWRERYYESDFRDYKNFLFYCNLNRFQTLLSRYNTYPEDSQN